MRVSVVAVAIATGVALAVGGRLGNLPTERPRWPWLVPAAVVLLLAPPVLSVHSAGAAPALAALAALVAFAAANLRMVGMSIVLVGLTLNAVVILANGAMPVDPAAVVATGLARGEELASLDLGPARRWRDAEDRVAVLGDILPVALLDEVVSFGDLIVAAGLANVTFRLLRPLRPSPPPRARRRAPRHRRPLLSMPFPVR